jgi:hypothetical protein
LGRKNTKVFWIYIDLFLDGYFPCKVALAYCNNGEDRRKVEDLIGLFRDALFHIPASSIAVEKLHACTQRNCAAHTAGRNALQIQENSYVMSSVLEHTRLKSAVEDETLGFKKHRAGRLLHQRVVSRTLPGKMTSRTGQRQLPKRPTIMKLGCFYIQ